MKFNLLETMKNEILNFIQKNSGICKSSGKRLPDADECELTEAKANVLLEQIGLKRNLKRNLLYSSNKHKKANRYMEHQIIRARKARDNNNFELFGVIARSCILKSKCFRASAFNKSFPDGIYSGNINSIYSFNKRVQKLIKNGDDNLKFHRVYIPKCPDTFRPLGVPSGEGRIVSQMGNNFITLYFENKLEFNHGFQPGKGTLTCGKEIILNVLKHKYIYEFDLNKFFDNVEINKVTEILEKSGVPKRIIYHLENINRCTPENINDVQEQMIKNKYNIQATFKSEIPADMKIFTGLQSFIDANGMDLLNELMKEDGYDDPYEYAQAQGALFDHYKPHGFEDSMKGLPQGLNTSPILSILTLIEKFEEFKAKGIKMIMYADDGILYSNKPFKVEGPEINVSKSGGLRVEGKGIVDSFKFLGLRYYTETQELGADTRKGSKLKFDDVRKGLFDLLKLLKGEATQYSNLENLAKSNLFGMIQSRLYNGSGDLIDKPEKPFEIKPNSLLGIYKKDRNRLSSSHGVYYLLDAVTHSMEG